MSRLDLHLHTTHSDGSFTPAEVIELAHKAGVTALAITDHDITTGIPEAIATGLQLGIEIIPGIEISSVFGDSELHILGYFLDWHDPKLSEQLSTLRESRHRRNPKIIERLQESGIDITYDEVRALAGTDSVGRPHIARVLMEKKVVGSAKEAFDRFLANGKPAYVSRDLPSPAEAIQWIKSAKGLAVLAHPTWVKTTEGTLTDLVRQLKAAGLDGVEVHYSTHTARQTREYLSLAKQLGLLITGGSDFHGITKPDIEVGIGKGTLHIPDSLLPKLKDAAARL
ncbi:MAG TPA: PHP domain-containing protein [Nitrospiraceae bacterium]|nr:PHP domain-containing protein [Nitrospiraceae bacterium]